MRTVLLATLLFLAHLISAQPGHEAKNIAQDIPFSINVQDIYQQLVLDRSTNLTLELESAQEQYQVEKVKTMVDDFYEKYPDIHSYKITSTKDKAINGRITVTPENIWITLKSPRGVKTIYPDMATGTHKLEKEGKHKYTAGCSHDSSNPAHVSPTWQKLRKKVNNQRGENFNFGETLRRYRFAVVCTGEYYQANGNTNNAVNASIVSSIDGFNVVYNNNLNVELIGLIPVLFNNPSGDPFTPDQTGGEGRTVQASIVVGSNFSSNTYDIGHVLHTHNDGSDGWGSGGVAYLGVVCNENSQQGGILKAGGWSGSRTNSGFSWISLACHEIGHMFGAEHTFNGDGGSCDDAIAGNPNTNIYDNAYEMASGTTIMSYNGICGTDQNIPDNGALDNYFHTRSLFQMSNYILSQGDCAVEVNTGNSAPVVDANPCNESYMLPRSTPYRLRGEATDADDDAMTYTWEQYDEDGSTRLTQGEIGSQAASNIVGPLVKCYPPSTSLVRYVPPLSGVIQGINDPFEVLSRQNREINFQFTVRDNQGAIATDDLLINNINDGPLFITNPGSLTTGENADIVWDANGSEAACNNVNVLLSVDGGNTFPYNLGTSIPYADQMLSIVLPTSIPNTTMARIMVECADNDCFTFYNISPNFSISSLCRADMLYICDTEPLSADQGDPSLNLNVNTIVGAARNSMRQLVDDGETFGSFIVTDANGNCREQFNNFFANRKIAVTKSGRYDFRIEEGRAALAIFEADGYDEDSPCSSTFLGSTHRDAGGGSFFPGTFLSVNLEECKEYIISFYNLDFETTILSYISGPAEVIEVNDNPNPEYGITYIAVSETGIVTEVSSTADFTTLPGGSFQIYSTSYKQGGVTPPAIQDPATWKGKSLVSILSGGNCLLRSFNSKPVEVESGCGILAIEATNQTVCDPATNTYNQTISITYENPPTSGFIIVNTSGGSGGNMFQFAIAGNPQLDTLPGLPSNGQSVSINAEFSAQPSCALFLQDVFTAPGSCCPIDVDLGGSYTRCAADVMPLDAGDDGTAYQWLFNDVPIAEATESTYLPTESGTYTVEVTAPAGCVETDIVEVLIHPNPVTTLPDDETICEGEPFTIDAMINFGDINWFFNGADILGENTASLTITDGGQYVVSATSDELCFDSDTIDIMVVPAPIADLGPKIELCDTNIPISLDAGDDGDTYTWFQGPSPLAETGSMLEVGTSGQYIVQVEKNGCTKSDTVIVEFFPFPQANAGDDMNICQGGDAINIFYSFFGGTYIWYRNGELFENQEDPLIVSEAGEYVLEVRSDAGCITYDTVQVDVVLPPVVDLGDNILACEESEVTLTTTLEGTYIWVQEGEGPVGTDQELIVTEPGNYILIVLTAGSDCQGTDTVNVEFTPGPALEIGNDQTICQGEEANIVATTGVSNVTWLLDEVEIPGETSTTLVATEPGIYTARIMGMSGCIVEDMLTLTVNDVPQVDIGDDRGICDGESVVVMAGVTGDTYSWTLGGNMISADDEVEVSEAGELVLTVTNEFNCSASDMINISVGAAPDLALDAEYRFCEGNSIDITAMSNATSFEWTVGGTVISETGATITVSDAAEVSVIGTNAENCTNNAMTTVVSSPSPTVDLGEDVELCPEDDVMLDAGSQSTYLWSTTEDSQEITITNNSTGTVTEQMISVTVTNADGCEAMDQVTVTSLPALMPQVTASAAGVCGGAPVELTATGGSTFTWIDPTGTLSNVNGNMATAMPTETTTYEVSAANESCPDSEVSTTVVVAVFERGEDLSAGEEKCNLLGSSIELEAVGGVSYLWQDAATIVGATDIPNPEVNPSEETVYFVDITDANGCTYRDSVTICITEDPLGEFLLVSIITPNGDGDNDELEFRGLEAFPDNTLTIYNRWGNVVFNRARYQQEGELWDGTNGGEPLAADTYYYILTFDGNTYKSPITIMR